MWYRVCNKGSRCWNRRVEVVDKVWYRVCNRGSGWWERKVEVLKLLLKSGLWFIIKVVGIRSDSCFYLPEPQRN